MNVAGLDLSITATGAAYPDGHLDTWRYDGGDERLVRLSQRTVELLDGDRLDLVVIEDLPRHAHGAGITAMVHGIVRYQLLCRVVPYVLVPPGTLKTYACGKGNATKPDMRVELFKRTGLDVRDDNQVDAYWLRALGCDLLDAPLLDLPKDHRRALDKLTFSAAT